VENKDDGPSNALNARKECERCSGLQAEQAKILKIAEMREEAAVAVVRSSEDSARISA
jgi:recombinational DNA repair protein RecR